NEKSCRIRGDGIVQEAVTIDGRIQIDLRDLAKQAFYFAGDLIRAFERRRIRELNADNEIPLVFFRDEAARYSFAETDRNNHDTAQHQQGDDHSFCKESGYLYIPVSQPPEDPVKGCKEP